MESYNSTSPLYDERYLDEQKLKIGFMLGRVRLPGGGVVLDAGCGTGALIESLGSGLFIGVDPSPGMIRRARERAERWERGGLKEGEGGGAERGGREAELIVADLEALPIRGSSCDAVFSVTVLQLLDDPAKGISELQRVLKDGGAAAISVLRKAGFAGRLGDLAPAIRGEVYDSETMKDVFLIGRKA